MTSAMRPDDTTLERLRQQGRDALAHFNEVQFGQFDEGLPVSQLLKDRSNFIDQLLKRAWRHFGLETQASLVAVGGYGREALFPYSDVDLLILTEQEPDTPLKETLSRFITLLWDWGLDLGSAVRTPESCAEEGRQDVTIATNLLEARWITGLYAPFEQLRQLWKQPDFWPSAAFYEAKKAEQDARRDKVQGTLYQLEPNIKECPGGLRDIQTIFWIARRHLNARTLYDLIRFHLITPQEYAQLEAADRTLSRFRFALHRYKKRREDRLLFDHQQLLAEKLGYEGETPNRRVERLMQQFYRTTRTVLRMNEVLLAHFRELIFDQNATPRPLTARFQTLNDFLDLKDPDLLEQQPMAIFEAFLLFTYYPHLKGLRARTIRAIQNALTHLDSQCRHEPVHKALFLEILRQPHGVYHSLKYMHHYGLLDRYIPQFGRIAGLMQFNMFHAYPVDEHTLLVIRNLRRFFIDKHAWEFPTAHQIARRLCKPELLFLAGLFHDITKGDEPHAETGAVFAEQWCREHNLPEADTRLVAWLVRHHLDFSETAQKQDLSDPEVIRRFAARVENQTRLDYLYLLTLADVLSTSPDVWNDWKNALFLELYNETSKALDQSQEIPRDIANKALQHQEKARELLSKSGLHPSAYRHLWNTLAQTEFFYRQTPVQISRITRILLRHDMPIVSLSPTPVRGATELLIYMPDRDFLFAQITRALEKLRLNIMEAQIYGLTDGNTLMLFYLLDEQQPLSENQREATAAAVRQALEQPFDPKALHTGQASRKIRCFTTPTHIQFAQHPSEQLTELFLSTQDIPGLLASLARVFVENQIRLHSAKITTVGEKVEDIFLISTRDNQPLDKTLQESLRQAIIAALPEAC